MTLYYLHERPKINEEESLPEEIKPEALASGCRLQAAGSAVRRHSA